MMDGLLWICGDVAVLSHCCRAWIQIRRRSRINGSEIDEARASSTYEVKSSSVAPEKGEAGPVRDEDGDGGWQQLDFAMWHQVSITLSRRCSGTRILLHAPETPDFVS